MFIATSRRRSPSTMISLSLDRRSMICRRRPTSSSLSSLTRVSGLTFAIFRSFSDVVRPMPWMYVSEITTRLSRGMSTPARRATTQPCLCLCFGFEQRTRTTPSRLITLHFEHIFLTDGRTFISYLAYLAFTLRILPRDRSLSESSTPTLSPATSRTKWVLRRSATCARTLTPFSSSTLYMPFGRGSRTRPSTSTGGRGTRRDYTATQYSYHHWSGSIPGSSESSHRDPLRQRSVRPGKHTRTVLCDRHRVFEVRRQ